MMESLVELRRMGWFAELGNILMFPIMRFLSGAKNESPQKTHPWNVQSLPECSIGKLEDLVMIHEPGVEEAISRYGWWDPRFHMPIFKGWRRYVVIDSWMRKDWHIGWKIGQYAQVSMFPVLGPVRVLVGAEDVSFFGLDAQGVQIPIFKMGEGRIGDDGEFSYTPLL